MGKKREPLGNLGSKMIVSRMRNEKMRQFLPADIPAVDAAAPAISSSLFKSAALIFFFFPCF